MVDDVYDGDPAADDEETGKGCVHEAEDILAGAVVKLTPEDQLAYWGYLRRWRALSADPKHGSADCPPRWDIPAHIFAAEKHRRDLVAAIHRRKEGAPEQLKALAGVNAFLFLAADDDRLPSWAREV